MGNLYYKGSNPTVDLVIVNEQNQILLIKRSESAEACPNMWALPGGFIDGLRDSNDRFKYDKETAEIAAIREVKEETNLDLGDIEITNVGIYVGNNRDPRDSIESWSESHAFFYKIPNDIFNKQKNNIIGLDDAQEAKWISLNNINKINLAFDHKVIIDDAIDLCLNKNEKIKSKIKL